MAALFTGALSAPHAPRPSRPLSLWLSLFNPITSHMHKLIGLYSSAAQSGKSTVAKHLEKTYGYRIVPFAQTLKEMAVPMLEALGHSREEALDLLMHDKERTLSLGITVRHLLRTLGTEWGRECIHPDVWLHCWQERIQGIKHVVVDDVRFPNEAELVKRLGGTMVRVERPGAYTEHQHSSEGSLDHFDGFDFVLRNDGDVPALLDKVEQLMA